MQQLIKYSFASVAAAVALLSATLAGCSKSDLPDDGNGIRTALTITVTDGGYAPAAGEQPHTRAKENGYQTEFTAGDKIGLYVVKNGAVIDANICLTAANNSTGGLSWTPPAGGKVWYYNTGTTYYAYYPYQSDMAGKVTAGAANAAAFFKPLTDSWTPAADQSTYAKYTAQDLMTGTGAVSGSKPSQTLAVSLTHRMALVVIKTPVTVKYKLSTDANYTWNVAVSNLKFSGFTPYTQEAGVHRYLVKPGTNNQELSGNYTFLPSNSSSANHKEFFFTPGNVNSGSYKTYTVDSNLNPISHTLQMGDFYMKEGALVGKDVTLTSAQKTACLGIVLKVGKDGFEKWVDDCTYKTKAGGNMNTIHGYVLAAYDADVCHWGSQGTSVPGIVQSNAIGFYGYKYTQAIKSFNNNAGTLQANFPATYQATVAYDKTYPAPVGSSGWFLPSAGQCEYWVGNRDLLLKQVKKATGAAADWNNNDYWASSEGSSVPSAQAWNASFGGNYTFFDPKGSSCCVRSFLAF